MKLLKKYLQPFRGLLALAVVLATINQTFSLLDPQILRLIVDGYITNYHKYTWPQFNHGVGLLLLGMIGVAMVSRIAKNFQDYYVNVITQSFGAKLYADGIQHSLSLPFSDFEDQRSGETLQQISKARLDSQDLISGLINSVFLSFVTLVIVIGYAFSVHWTIGVAYLITFPLLGGFIAYLSKRLRKVQQIIFSQMTDLAGSSTESLRNIELIKASGLERQEILRLNATNSQILDLELSKIKTIRMISFVQGTVVNASRVLILFLMVNLIFKQLISPGQFFTLMFYSFFIVGPLNDLGTVIAKYQEARVSLENLDNIFKKPVITNNNDGLNPSEINKIEFKGVSFKHKSSSEAALNKVNFSVEAGKSVAFVGPSGAGKSTLVKMLLNLYEPDQGEVLINGQIAQKYNLEAIRQKIGFVPQSIELFSGSLRDNLLFVMPEATDEECLLVLKQAQLQTFLDKAEAGLDVRIGEGGMKLSGGERQRLAIARALLRKPDILIFDEATSSLDSGTEAEISKTIAEIIKTHTNLITVMIAHRLSTISSADEIIVLEKGNLVERGSHLELLEEKGLYYALWRQQIGERNS